MQALADLRSPSKFIVVAAPPAPEVSVCIVNWNCRELLRACLESLVFQEQGVELEVIVVDNGSADGAADMVASDFPEVRVIRNDHNEAFAKANNQAARLARGRFLFFLNNDTRVPTGTLRRLVAEAQRRPEFGILAPRLLDERGETQCSIRELPSVSALLHRTCLFRWTGLFRSSYRRYRKREAQFERTRRVDVVMGAAMFLRRRVFETTGGWDESYRFGGEDIDLCARVGLDRPVIYCPAVSVIHHGRASSRQRIGYAHTETVIGITRFLRKNGASSFSLWIYKFAVTVDAPLQWLGHLAQYCWRKARGRTQAATRSLLVVRALGHFLCRGLGAFWRV